MCSSIAAQTHTHTKFPIISFSKQCDIDKIVINNHWRINLNIAKENISNIDVEWTSLRYHNHQTMHRLRQGNMKVVYWIFIAHRKALQPKKESEKRESDHFVMLTNMCKYHQNIKAAAYIQCTVTFAWIQ